MTHLSCQVGLWVVVRLVGRRLGRRCTERGIHGALELSNRVAFSLVDVRGRVGDILLAKVDEPRGVRNLLASSTFLDEVDNILFDFAMFKRETNLFTRLDIALALKGGQNRDQHTASSLTQTVDAMFA